MKKLQTCNNYSLQCLILNGNELTNNPVYLAWLGGVPRSTIREYSYTLTAITTRKNGRPGGSQQPRPPLCR